MQKEEILEEIQRTAQENGGNPLGVDRFANVTGIKPYDWGRYWSRFSDAQREAGFEPNQLNAAHNETLLIESLISLTRELKQFPTRGDMRLKRIKDSGFPTETVFYRRFGEKNKIIGKVIEYCNGKPEYKDVVELLEPVYENDSGDVAINNEAVKSGYVYLVRGHPGEYKIGRTNLVDRRLSELGATSSIEQTLIHEVKTDDPAGIEAYWHRRFQEKRMKGEWFRLNPSDVKAFKRWRRIY